MHNSVLLFCLVFYLIQISSIDGKSTAQILGGLQATEGEFKYHANIVRKPNNIQFCGGALISKRHVLTAAHCLLEELEETTAVIFGSIWATGIGGVTYNVSKLILHEDFNLTTHGHDIGIILLEIDVTETSKISIAGLPTTPLASNVEGVFAGWGKITLEAKKGQITYPKIRKKIYLTTLDAESCGKLPSRKSRWLRNDSICLHKNFNKKSGACNGDSGGGFVVKQGSDNIVVGIASGVFGECGTTPDEFTMVYHHIEWIKKIMAQE